MVGEGCTRFDRGSRWRQSFVLISRQTQGDLFNIRLDSASMTSAGPESGSVPEHERL